MITRTEKLINYTKIDNTYLEDKNISLKAKGLFYLHQNIRVFRLFVELGVMSSFFHLF